MSSEEEEYDKFGQELLDIQDAMKKSGFPLGQVSGWDDDTEGIEEDRNPFQAGHKEILHAAENGNLDEVRRLLLTDPTLVSAQDKDGYTPLHRACYNDHVEVVDYLLSQGACISAETEDKWQPLHSACRWNNAKCAAKLLEHGADVNASTVGGQTALHLAASNSHAKETLQVLLMHPKIRSDVLNSSEELPVDVAKRSGRYHYLFEMADPCINII